MNEPKINPNQPGHPDTTPSPGDPDVPRKIPVKEPEKPKEVPVRDPKKPNIKPPKAS